MPGDAVRWMTYQELGDTLGIGSDSARNLVRRRRWARQTGNDGLARIGVPVEHLEAHADGGSDAPLDPPADGDMVAALEAHLAGLQGEVARLAALNATGRADLEREQGRADALTQELASVREALARSPLPGTRKRPELVRSPSWKLSWTWSGPGSQRPDRKPRGGGRLLQLPAVSRPF